MHKESTICSHLCGPVASVHFTVKPRFELQEGWLVDYSCVP